MAKSTKKDYIYAFFRPFIYAVVGVVGFAIVASPLIALGCAIAERLHLPLYADILLVIYGVFGYPVAFSIMSEMNREEREKEERKEKNQQRQHRLDLINAYRRMPTAGTPSYGYVNTQMVKNHLDEWSRPSKPPIRKSLG